MFSTVILDFSKRVLCKLSDDTVLVGVSELFGELLNFECAKRWTGT